MSSYITVESEPEGACLYCSAVFFIEGDSVMPELMLPYARDYAAQDLYVFPCAFDKSPITKNGYRDGSKDIAQIERWWGQNPYAMIGCVTGPRTDVILLDVDIKRGVDGRASLKKLRIDVSGCPQAVTPSGGSHYYFRLGGKTLRNSQGKLGPGLDVRGQGGYAILPPSTPDPRRPGYAWVNDISLAAAPVISPELEALLKEKTDELTAECNKIRAAKPGERNAVLNACAFKIAKIVLGGRLQEAGAREALTEAALEIGLEREEIDKTLKSAFEAREREKEGKGGSSARQGRRVMFPDVEPWDTEVEGEELLDEIAAAIHRHIIMSDDQGLATALWSIHSYCIDAATHSPRLHLWGPTRRCGKTQLCEVLYHLVRKPLLSETMTISVLFRVVDAHQPTIIVDEADLLLKDNDELRAGLNAGFQPTGMAHRIVGDDLEPRGFSMWSPVVISGIGKLHPTLADRSIDIDLVRKKKSETIGRLDAAAKSELLTIGRRIARWSKDHLDRLKAARPELPSSINDRACDCWEPLLAIASEIGEDVRRKTFAAAIALTAEDADEAEAGIVLLSDIRAVFDSRVAKNIDDADKIASAALVTELINMEGRPWSSWRKGKAITQNAIGRLLKPFGIRPGNVWFAGNATQFKGYLREHFDEAFSRYL
ncbi:DUF3631 domain-containing protein [Nordella sp. HKS 07]|uniref:DUF3631 domain-containing protein n=1 Tax=Nordella sp. HKS 07 TaxID=2712222 RepID=UPI0013E0F2FC|nr:DUF3631 domain-containing protein [Nordella sp. HKS 07]QIG46665.1 DUF3631 domain-containing protein [Nordella sp. HKS 07]